MNYLWKPQAFRNIADRELDRGQENILLSSEDKVTETRMLNEHFMCK